MTTGVKCVKKKFAKQFLFNFYLFRFILYAALIRPQGMDGGGGGGWERESGKSFDGKFSMQKVVRFKCRILFMLIALSLSPTFALPLSLCHTFWVVFVCLSAH